MPYFYLKGKPILPNNADCPVEIVSASTNAPSADFFKHGSSGRVELTGVTDSGYQLVTPSTTAIAPANEDVFESKLKINGAVQKYCKKGVAPLGSLLTQQGAGTYYLRKYADGSVYLLNSSYNSIATLSTAAQSRKLFTIVLQGAGGGGAGGKGDFWSGGNDGDGGGGGGIAIGMLNLIGQSEITYRIVVGSGGSGGNNSGGSGGTGGATTLYASESGSTYIMTATGGGGGTLDSGGSGGGASANTASLLAYEAANGASGGHSANGGSTSGFNAFIFNIKGEYLYISGYSGGSAASSYGGAGGASYFGNGGSAAGVGGTGGTGAGGGGGDAWNTGASPGGSGGAGLLRIYY